jgi:hemoglobin
MITIKKDIQNIQDIKLFVNEFYNLVQQDELLSPIFISRNQGIWGPHLEQMYLFWNTALFGEKGYVGNPFSKHITLNINADHFNRWLNLFNQTIDTYFKGEIANNAKWRAGIMADTFLRRLKAIPNTSLKPIL